VADEHNAQEQIVSALRRIIRAVDLHSRFLAQRYGLTGPQLVVLQQLERHGPRTAGELAEAVSLGQATLSNILERLEGRKLLRRRRSHEDKRCVINELTKAGRDALRVAPPLLQDRFVQELEKLEDWERSQILSTLQRVAHMMHAQDIDASPVLASGPAGVSAEGTAEFLTADSEDDSREKRRG
jgi:DNA-binding MarR family transcriptional regulator